MKDKATGIGTKATFLCFSPLGVGSKSTTKMPNKKSLFAMVFILTLHNCFYQYVYPPNKKLSQPLPLPLCSTITEMNDNINHKLIKASLCHLKENVCPTHRSQTCIYIYVKEPQAQFKRTKQRLARLTPEALINSICLQEYDVNSTTLVNMTIFEVTIDRTYIITTLLFLSIHTHIHTPP